MSFIGYSPHHDGSALYIANQRPALGEKVRVKIRIHKSIGKVQHVLLRNSDSGEAFFSKPFKPFPSSRNWTLYEGFVVMHNPDVHYRFYIELSNGLSYWYNSTGLHDLDQADRDDFKINVYNTAPKWTASAVMYQIFPDRFAKSSAAYKHKAPDWALPKAWDEEVVGTGPGVAEQFFGGDLIGAIEHLDHLKKIGANVLYMTPIFPAQSNHRYDSKNFDEVDPLLGGNKALIELVKKCHELGIRVMGDLTANHSGNAHEWFLKAYKNPSAKESEFYYFSEGNKKYESWWGVPSLPKLNWNSKELRKRFIEGKKSVVAKWLQKPYALDGWRIDVANMTGWIHADNMNKEVGQIIRKTVQDANSEAFLIGEATSDAAQLFSGDGYMGAMTYANFTRPLWRWLWNPKDKREEGQVGLGRKVISAREFVELHNRFAGTFPWHMRSNNLNALDTHDTGRFKTFTIPGAQKVAAGMQFTFPGIPMIFAGDEFGLDGFNGESSRTPMPWNGERKFDSSMIEIYAQLGRLRKSSKALQQGSLRWIYASDEALVYTRETKTEAILVLATRGNSGQIRFPVDAVSDTKKAENLFGGGQIKRSGDQVVLDAKALDLQIWRLPSPVG
ncbi:MAG: hypothetical protein RLZZ579_1147 [Actinomycetota bacterium]